MSLPQLLALVSSPQTGRRWRAELRRLAERDGCRIAMDWVTPPRTSGPALPFALAGMLRADGWRPAGIETPSTRTQPQRDVSSPAADAPRLAVLLGHDASDPTWNRTYPDGALFATASGSVLGGNNDLIVEVARGIPTTCIQIWWARNTQAPVCILQSIAMMRSTVARVNDDLFATRVAELLLEGARLVHNALAGEERSSRVVLARTPQVVDALTQAAAQDVRRAATPLSTRDAFRMLERRLRAAVGGRARTRMWGIGYRRSRDEDATTAFARLAESEWLTAPPGVTWADPFPVHTQGVDLLFFEEQAHPNAAGQLRCAELFADGRLGTPVSILESTTHLSYPNVFRWQDAWFMVPESSAQRVVSLYRSVDFPFRWQHECDLIRGEALVDATLLEHDGSWYLFATRISADDVALEDLVCYIAPTLTGPWQPHIGNPVVSDAYRGRPAGQFLREAGMLLRPAQDSSVTYGHGVSLQQVTALSAKQFAERTVVHRIADWAPDVNGLHTFNRSATLTCIDVARRVRRVRRGTS